MNGKKNVVLIVEDQKINRKVLTRILEKDYITMEAENGLEAMRMLEQEENISVILLDLIMPVMDGYELLRRLPEIKKENIPVIVITADVDTTAEVKALELGAIDFITKPIIPQILLSRLRNAVIRNQMVLLERLRYQSDYDSLTGLYNRNKMFEETKQMVKQHPDMTFAFVRFDIDQFRLYNSAMGEKEGNRLITYIGSALRRMAEDFLVCTYGRIDADVFCMCEPYDADVIETHVSLAQKEMNKYREDYVIDTSFGIYVIDEPVGVETMFTRASMASDKCKNLYEQHFAYYEKSMGNKVLEEQEITNEMRNALDEEQFVVYLQPKYDLNTEQPCGAEALVRWLHPEKGLVSPGKFIPVFEKNGFIARLDYYMWENVCKLLKKWKDTGIRLAPVSVNMSRVSLYNPHVTDLLVDLIQKYDVDPQLLNLEVTESAYMSNPDLMKELISSLQEAGFKILMDDFGSGYSSLNTLKEIDVDILKIDMKFLPNGKDNGKSEKILSSMIRMAGWLGMPVIAEGVENVEQKDFLESIGCGYVQGFYYAKPMPVSDYEKLMTNTEGVDTSLLTTKEQDSEMIWSSNPQIEDILKSISLPIAIVEYSSSNTEIIRVNQVYNELYGSVPLEHFNREMDPSAIKQIKKAFEIARDDGRTQECSFSYLDESGKNKWVCMKIRRIGKIPKSSILCCTFLDITEEINFKNQLRRIEDAFKNEDDKKQLLVIDDLEVSRDLVHSIFDEDYEILDASNGREGLQLLKENYNNIAVILLDMVMPEMDGREFLEIKKSMTETSNIPVVIISSEDGTKTQLKMLKMGVNDYITKPFVPEIVEQRVKNVIDYNSRFHLLVSEYDELAKKE